jgi:hypothetical protein
MDTQLLTQIHAGLVNGRVIPYFGPGVLSLAAEPSAVPATADALVAKLVAKASVPHKIRNNLTASAQFIENFKHRKTVSTAMTEAFSRGVTPTALHRYIASLPGLLLWVHAWYDDLPQRALAEKSRPWGMAQGVSQAEHFGQWVRYYDADGRFRDEVVTATAESPWPTLLYQPIGSVGPAANYLVSDSDYVEVLTEIDIQSPIPRSVQQLRTSRSFLFLGCRFNTQLERIFAQQIIKRSGGKHWAVLPQEPTRNEARFLAQQNIQRIDTPLDAWAAALIGLDQEAAALRVAG